jgi:uncharacterized protein (TIGR03435 family)
VTKIIISATLLAIALGQGHCQSPVQAPAFEVASITPCKPDTPAPPGEHAGMVRFTYPGGRFTANATTLSFLLEWAYGIQPFQHGGGPSWMATDRYDVMAKAGGNASDAQMRLMAQTLLTERFKLKFHRENRNLPVYVISVGATPPKLYPPKDDDVHGIQVTPRKDQDQKVVSFHVAATRFSLKELTDTFARQLGRVIVNETGLTGEFDFTLDMTPDEERPNPLDPSLIMKAMREQLGLTLTAQKAPVDFFVVDSAEKVAAGNN